MHALEYVAFSTDPAGGNPAGVVLDATGASEAEMLACAAGLGHSETAFLTGRDTTGAEHVRYFSPLAEVPFCGHATIAAAVAHAERHGPGRLRLATAAGEVVVATQEAGGAWAATLVSVPTHTAELGDADLTGLLDALRWRRDELDPGLPPRVAYAGAYHPVIAAATRDRLSRLDYDFPALGGLMAASGWTTVQLIWRRSAAEFFSRNPFPPGGVVEDPATGAAAAAFGGYLRELDLISTPASLTIHQGDDLGRPGILRVDVPTDRSTGISVTGTAVRLRG